MEWCVSACLSAGLSLSVSLSICWWIHEHVLLDTCVGMHARGHAYVLACKQVCAHQRSAETMSKTVPLTGVSPEHLAGTFQKLGKGGGVGQSRGGGLYHGVVGERGGTAPLQHTPAPCTSVCPQTSIPPLCVQRSGHPWKRTTRLKGRHLEPILT